MASYQSIRYNVDYGGKAGALMPLATTTVSSSTSTVSFTGGIDDTFDEYLIIVNSLHPSESADLQMNFSADTGSNYNVTKTSSVWLTWVAESGGNPNNGYNTGADIAQGTGFFNITNVIVGDGDATASGWIRLYNPASTTFVKHFIADFQRMDSAHSAQMWTAGYANTTSAIDAFRFQMESGTIDTGTFELYGVH